MSNITNINLDYNRPIKMADEVYWVGAYDDLAWPQANPYLIIDGDEAVVIDSGSRSAFPTVMMKIMQTGISPSTIRCLIYQNNDARLCASIPHLESIIDRPNLKIISDENNYMFIQHYSETAVFLSLADIDFQFKFSSGRLLEFIKVPYAHAAGSFITFDRKSGILFTGDLFSSYGSGWNLFFSLQSGCRQCRGEEFPDRCRYQKATCAVEDILTYHREILTSERALKLAIERIAGIPFKTIAPQQGSVIHEPDDIVMLFELLSTLKGVGIDKLVGDRSFFELGNIDPVKTRMGIQ